VYWLPTDRLEEQLAEISQHFGIRADSGAVMSRCSRCGSSRLTKIERDEAARDVSARILTIVTDFWKCEGCGKVRRFRKIG
jgi:uncharacterized protein with PIN domain